MSISGYSKYTGGISLGISDILHFQSNNRLKIISKGKGKNLSDINNHSNAVSVITFL